MEVKYWERDGWEWLLRDRTRGVSSGSSLGTFLASTAIHRTFVRLSLSRFSTEMVIFYDKICLAGNESPSASTTNAQEGEGVGGGVATRPHGTKGKRKEKSLRGMNPSRRSKPTTNECMTVRDHGRTADLEATWSETSPFRPLLPSFLLPPSDKTSFGRTPRPPPRPDPNLHPSPRVVPLFRLDLHLLYYILIYIYHVGLATDSRTLVRTRNSNRELRPTYRSFRIDV